MELFLLISLKTVNRVSESENRMEICKSCDRFQQELRFCKECGCFMPVKVKFVKSVCPLNKW